MKLRLKTADLTSEDHEIFAQLYLRIMDAAVYESIAVVQDRRDADLMFDFQRIRRAGVVLEMFLPNASWLRSPETELKFSPTGGDLRSRTYEL